MIPRWHIFWGATFTILIWIFSPTINPIYLILIFLSSFLIDFDHYLTSYILTKNWRLKHSLKYHEKRTKEYREQIKKGIKKKGDFHLFHTIEFHALVALLGLLWSGFFYIFIGMVFHSLLDIIALIKGKGIHIREYFFFNWLRRIVK